MRIIHPTDRRTHGTRAHRPTLRAVAVVLAAASLVACGGSDDAGDPASDQTSDVDRIAQIFTDSGAPESEARCVAEELDGVAVHDIEQFMAVAEAEGEGASLEADVLIKIGEAVQACGLA
ncbi:MAG: hypothetical protein AAFP84_17695 [Actinomycetota bacterium]